MQTLKETTSKVNSWRDFSWDGICSIGTFGIRTWGKQDFLICTRDTFPVVFSYLYFLQKTYPVQLASNEASINLVNTFKCPVTFKDIENGQTISIGARSNIHLQQITAGVYNLQKTSENCDGVEIPESLTFNTTAGQVTIYFKTKIPIIQNLSFPLRA